MSSLLKCVTSHRHLPQRAAGGTYSDSCLKILQLAIFFLVLFLSQFLQPPTVEDWERQRVNIQDMHMQKQQPLLLLVCLVNLSAVLPVGLVGEDILMVRASEYLIFLTDRQAPPTV